MSARIFVAELIGTFFLVLIGPGSAAIGGSLVAVAFAHGLIVLSFAYAYGYISGTHINPAVSIGLWVGRQIDFGVRPILPVEPRITGQGEERSEDSRVFAPGISFRARSGLVDEAGAH